MLALHAKDEIGRYVRGRRLCSMDAMWRLMGFQTYPASDPPVTGVKVRSPNFMLDYTDKKKLTDLIVYFARPAELSVLRFAEFFSQFRTVRLRPTRGVENQPGRIGISSLYWMRRDSAATMFLFAGVILRFSVDYTVLLIHLAIFGFNVCSFNSSHILHWLKCIVVHGHL